ncbi:uncharacterized protein BX664DRAFT_323266 [Halteromyces radiatus]|uniref:uncharacterized protein n=1 Tax=Halteromyces radiatus TaxID=101107 RepID=UPI0022203E12|nr:uncharacterized protein BX664DRAFT_323266 [Halteromyces radiatus]KAI8096160.1 hypothetical protein BX664DRAFT_323266 [Halteromyces radiatus]
MSFYDFINKGTNQQQNDLKSSVLSPSIADELFESHFVQSTTPSNHGTKKRMPSSSVNSPSLRNSQYTSTSVFDFIRQSQSPDISVSPSLIDQDQSRSVQTSAFSFINQTSQSNDFHLVDELVFATNGKKKKQRDISPRPSSAPQEQQHSLSSTSLSQLEDSSLNMDANSLSRRPVEVQRLFEETAWKRLKAEKQHHQDFIQQLYQRRKLTLDEIQKSQKERLSYSEEKQRYLEAEEYDKMDRLETQDQMLEQQIIRLNQDVMETITSQLQTAWMDMAKIIRKQGDSASRVAQVYQATRDERQQQLAQYTLDMERNQEHKLQEIQMERSKIESEKSEIAFDVDFWEQSRRELDEKMADLVQDERFQKEELVTKIHSIDEEIDVLQKKLELLKEKRQNYSMEINRLDYTMEKALQRYQPEKDAQDKERIEIDIRKKKVEQQAETLAEQDTLIHKMMKQREKDEDHAWKELNDMNDTIQKANEESQANVDEADTIMAILNDCIISRDQTMMEHTQKEKKMRDNIYHLQGSIQQQQKEYNRAQQQLEELETHLNMMTLRRTRLERQKTKAAEQGQYQQAAKWQGQIKQLDITIEKEKITQMDYQQQLHSIDTGLDSLQQQLMDLKLEAKTQDQHRGNLKMKRGYVDK